MTIVNILLLLLKNIAMFIFAVVVGFTIRQVIYKCFEYQGFTLHIYTVVLLICISAYIFLSFL